MVYIDIHTELPHFWMINKNVNFIRKHKDLTFRKESQHGATSCLFSIN